MEKAYAAGRYEMACGLLPPGLREAALNVDRERKAAASELRLRVDRPLHLVLPGGEVSVPGTNVTPEAMEQVLDRATEYSRYTASESLRRGYVTAEGGFRVGVCGTAVPLSAENTDIRSISSMAIRIPRAVEGAALPVLPELLEAGRPQSTLILSPPGGGKTTLLRDLVRLLSEGTALTPGHRVALVDERGELAAVHRGRPQLEVGPLTDILDGCPKAMAVPMLLRAMAPEIIALDELSLKEDVEAVLGAVGCGVVLLATVHAASVEELRRRPLFRGLLEAGAFRRAVVIEGKDRRCRVEVLP